MATQSVEVAGGGRSQSLQVAGGGGSSPQQREWLGRPRLKRFPMKGPLQHLVLWCNQSGPLRLPSLVLQWGFRRSSGGGWSMSLRL